MKSVQKQKKTNTRGKRNMLINRVDQIKIKNANNRERKFLQRWNVYIGDFFHDAKG